MSFDIQGVDRANGSARVNAAARVGLPLVEGVDATDGAVEVQTTPLSPPPEVLRAIGVASDAYDTLQDSGQQLHFGLDPTTGRLSVQLQDLDGNALAAVSPSTVLAIAGGQTS